MSKESIIEDAALAWFGELRDSFAKSPLAWRPRKATLAAMGEPWPMFAIERIDSDNAEALEPLGTKRKFWFTDARGRRLLFKAEARGTGEDWAEKLACEFVQLLGLPHVHYELALDTATRTPGVRGVC